MNNFCSACGAGLVRDTNFCGSCGTVSAVPVAVQVHAGATVAPLTFLPPPSLHWGIVLALSVLTLGVFASIWGLVQAIWVKRLTGTWRSIIWFAVICILHLAVLVAVMNNPNAAKKGNVSILFTFGALSTRRHVVKHFTNTPQLHLQISWGLTFFGSVYYLQYHFSRIARLIREQPNLFIQPVLPIQGPTGFQGPAPAGNFQSAYPQYQQQPQYASPAPYAASPMSYPPQMQAPQYAPVQAMSSKPSNTKAWVLAGLGGFFALVLVGTAATRFVSHAKEPGAFEVAKSVQVSSTTPSAPDVQVYIAPDTKLDSYHNVKYAYSVEFPRQLLIPQGESAAGDGQRFASKDGSFKMSVWGMFNVFDQTLPVECDESIESDRKDNSFAVTYKALKGTVCTYSGLAGSTIIYQKTVFLDDTFKTVRLEYPMATKETFDSVVNQIVSSFPNRAASNDKQKPFERESCEAAAKEKGAGSWNCTAAEFEREDARLNREYKRVIAAYKAQGREDNISSLRTEEIAWLKTMTSKCGHFEYDQPHGYNKAIAENTCRLDMTKSRADELEKLP